MNLPHFNGYHAGVSSRRPYKSSLREERARETRLRIRGSARTLFAEKGFAETTVAAIADHAGVSAQTIYATFGSKGAIVAAILSDIEETADQQTWVARIVAEEDPHRQLRTFVAWNRTLFERSTPVLRAVAAARGDPDVAALAQRGDASRRRGTRELTAVLAEKGALRDGLTPEQAAERLWLLTTSEQYLLATDELGWNSDDYETWLADLLERELLGSRRT